MTDPGGFELDRLYGEAASPNSVEEFEISGTLGPIRGDAYRARNAAGTVVICHGFKGFARWGFFPEVGKRIARAGLNAVAFDFSGSGVGENRETWSDEEKFSRNTFTAELADLDRVIAAARREGWVTGKFGLFGHSRGGGVAILHAAKDADVAALVTWNSISHVQRWSDVEADAWRKKGYTEIANSRTGQVFKMGTALVEDVAANAKSSLDIDAAAARVKAPWLILHGESDETVPAAEAERLHKASGSRATLRVIPGNHGFDGKHPLTEVPPSLERALGETVAFFTANLCV